MHSPVDRNLRNFKSIMFILHQSQQKLEENSKNYVVFKMELASKHTFSSLKGEAGEGCIPPKISESRHDVTLKVATTTSLNE